MRGPILFLVIAVVLGGCGLAVNARAGPPEATRATGAGTCMLVASTCGAGGRAGWSNGFWSHGTVGQAVPGGVGSRTDGTLYGGFWTLLLRGGYLPVGVELAYFTASRAGDEVTLRWKVVDDSGVVGFNVHRRLEGQLRERLTATPLPGRPEYRYLDRLAPEVRAEYWLEEIGRDGRLTWFGPITVLAGPASPVVMSLAPPMPNPLVSATAVAFSLPADGRVRIEVFDVGGRLLATIADEWMPDGPHSIQWDGSAAGGRLPAGVYVLRLTAGGEVRAQRLVIAR